MDNLHNGTVRNQQTGEMHTFFMRKLQMEDLNEIERMQQEVIRAADEKNTLQPLTTEEFKFILDGNGLMIGVFADGRLIGFRALLIPPIDEEHLGFDIGLPEEDLSSMLYQEISAVLPVYRGNRLQRQMADAIMERIPELQRNFRYIACTVAPMNIPSMKDKFSQGMRIAALKEKYEGLLRYIFVKDLGMEGTESGESVMIPAENVTQQKSYLKSGYSGTALEYRDGWFIRFER
ncbi:hypothetical protein [Indiicoccus explosivorum]|uniref:hypothetical protein n=1 Tax=Indiicoccus explosivorum TaxID=1917864 RepID=UPI001F4D7562|nr:hypothetical protein [Indiicoccus explosivorum]